MVARRYQVFVSSTYTDLQEERQEVLAALLELGCFPAGMEFFPAADADAWSHIERVIDDSDYYIVIVGGRYGSVSDNGLSFTEREYEYAKRVGKPVLAFLHADPAGLPYRDSEQNVALRARLEDFIGRLQSGHLTRQWKTAEGLRAAVATSLSRQMELTPQAGWTRPTEEPVERRSTAFEVMRHTEVLRLRPDGFDNDLTLDIRAAASGLEVFFRQIAGTGSTVVQDVQLLTPNMTLLKPFIERGAWTKAFVYLGRQLARGETSTVRLREIYGQDGPWDEENVHSYYTSHNLQRLELAVEYPEELRPVSAVFREYQGDTDMGDVLRAIDAPVTADGLRWTVDDPVIGHAYTIEWTMPRA